MRRTIILFALMINLLLFSGCGESAAAEEKFFQFRETLSRSEEIGLSGTVSASTDAGFEEYALSCSCSGSEYIVDIISPVQLAGVRAHISGKNLALEYDGVILDSGALTSSGITPVSSLPAVLDGLQSGYLERCWMEKEDDARYLTVQIAIGDTSKLVVWFDWDGMQPSAAEIYESDIMTASITVSDWKV